MEVFAARTLMKTGILAKLPGEGIQASMLERLLRLLVGTRFINRTPDGQYSHTGFSRAYLASPGDWFVVLSPLVRYPEYLDTNPELVEPHSITQNPYAWQHGMEGTNTWDVMGSVPERLARFQRGLGMMSPMNPVTGYYDFGGLQATEGRPVLVDEVVPDSASWTSSKLIPSSIQSLIILQDRAEVIELARLNEQLPGGLVKMSHDFFNPQPVNGASAYYLRMIIHDYADETATSILRHLAAAMAPDSRLILAETVVPDRVDEASLPAATIDLFEFICGGKERTVAGLEKILKAAGLELRKVWQPEGIAQAIVEALLG
ncbi:hypothetical protein LTR85_010460 [Meristemomyces frigidus]|nr:hypothetical protein LTR85_010460 [Meristemomyces frigidus]